MKSSSEGRAGSESMASSGGVEGGVRGACRSLRSDRAGVELQRMTWDALLAK